MPMTGARVKQVIVMRKDLKMRRGKEIAQGAHAAMAFLVQRIQIFGHDYGDGTIGDPGQEGCCTGFDLSPTEVRWLNNHFTKVTLQVNSEAELMEIHDAAVAIGLTAHVITDMGATEFHGVPTRTCLALGPDEVEKIDLVTRGLKLY